MKLRWHLAKGEYAAYTDQRTFTAWANNEISINKAIREFKFNNHISHDEKIDEVEFELWLNTLGYFRGTR